VPDDDDSLGIDTGMSAHCLEAGARVARLLLEAHREVVALRLPHSALVEPERGNTVVGERGRERIRDVQLLPRLVRVAIEGPGAVEQHGRRRRASRGRERQRAAQPGTVRGYELERLVRGQPTFSYAT
jgi:hypothetical protein